MVTRTATATATAAFRSTQSWAMLEILQWSQSGASGRSALTARPLCSGEPSPCHPFVSHAYQSTQVEPDTLYPAEQETSRRGNASADPFSRSTPRTVPWAAGRATPLTPTVSTNRSAATPHQRCKWPMRTQHRSTPLRPPRGVSARKLQRRKTLSYCTVPAQHGGC